MELTSQGYTIEDYQKFMEPYMYLGEPKKYQYAEVHNGWKIHLNVVPENVQGVSDFLKSNGYTHKLLKGGASIDRGKIFTVYFGPKALAEKSIIKISDGISHLLEETKDKAN